MRYHAVRSLASIILIGSIAACASSMRTVPRVASNRDIIEAAELDSMTAPSVLDLVQQLRPEWFQRATSGVRSIRGGSPGAGGDQLNVYVDNVRYRGTGVLSQLNPTAVMRIRYYSASEAQARFGNGNTAGVIHIITKGSAP